MDNLVRPPEIKYDKRVVGQGLGLLVGFLGVLASSVALFVPLNWAVSSNPPAAKTMAAIEYLFGTYEAHDIFFQSMFLLLISLFVIHAVWTQNVRLILVITVLFGVMGIGSLQYQSNEGKIFTTVAIFLALSAACLNSVS